MKRLIAGVDGDGHFAELVRKGAEGFVIRVTGAGLAFLFTVYLARTVSVGDYGLFMLALAVVNLLSVGARLGLDNVLVREISAARERGAVTVVRGYWRRGIMLVATSSAVITFAVFLLSESIANSIFRKPDFADPLNWMIWILMPYSVAFLTGEALKGVKQVGDSAIVQVVLIPGTSLILLLVGSAVTTWTLASVVSIYAGSVCIAALYGAWRWSAFIADGETSVLPVLSLLQKGFPLLLATSGGLVMSWTDTLVLGVFESPETVGIYAAATRTALVTSLILLAVNSIAAPQFAAFHAVGDHEKLARIARKATLLMSGLVLVPTALMTIWPELVLRLFGGAFEVGATALIVLALAQWFNVSCGSVAYLLSMTGHEKTVSIVMITTASINIVLNLLLVQDYGMEGVAAATACSTVLWNVWMLIVVRRRLGFWMLPLLSVLRLHPLKG